MGTRTTHKGAVYLTGYAVDAREGTVTKDEDNDRWRTDCELCEEFFFADSKKEAVRLLDEHFVPDHTTFLDPASPAPVE